MKFTHIPMALCFANFFVFATNVEALVSDAQLTTSNGVEVIKISGTRLGDEPIGAVSMLSRAQIEQINPSSTLDLLKRLPHIDVSENGNAGGFSYLSIRGGEFNFTLVTIDGIAVNDSTNSRGGGFDFNQINPAAIERIEVYRGGINTIYGGDAISGVINIVTRHNTSPVMSFEIGSNHQVNASITASSAISNSSSILASLSTQNKKVSVFEELQSHQFLLKGSYRQNTLNLGSLISFNQSDVVGFTEDSGGEVFANPRAAEKRDSEQWIIGLSGDYKLSEKALFNAQVSWLNREERIDNPGILEGAFSGIPASDITSDYTRLELDVFATFTLSPNTRFIAGANERAQNGSNRGFLDFGVLVPANYDFSQNISSAYIEVQHLFNDITVEASARYDAPEDFHSETSFRVGASYAVNDNTEVFAVFSEGYKLPSFFALAHPLVGNSELQPERSNNFEVGFSSQVSDTMQYSVVYFANQFEDLVDFDAALFTNVNRNKVNMSGLEVDTSVALNSWFTIAANARYLDIDAQSGVTLRKRPNIGANLRFELAYKNSQTTIFIDARDDVLDSSVATAYVRLPGYASIGISTLITLSPKFELSLNVENVLAKRIEDSVGFIQDKVEGRVGLRYRF